MSWLEIIIDVVVEVGEVVAENWLSKDKKKKKKNKKKKK